jgi:hypothetical protein
MSQIGSITQLVVDPGYGAALAPPAAFATPLTEQDPGTQYIVVSDRNDKVLMAGDGYHDCVRFANKVREAGGEVTIFRSTKG